MADQGATEEMIRRIVREEMQRVDRLAEIDSANADGTVTLRMDGQVIPSQPALTSLVDRTRGLPVVVRSRAGELLVMGHAGPPTPTVAVTLADTAAPGGQGWEQVSAVWCKGGTALWLQRSVVAPTSSVTRTITSGPTVSALATYRSGALFRSTYAEQGNYAGAVNQQGLATFGTVGGWGALAGKTATGGTITAHRMSTSHGNTFGPVSVYAYFASAGAPPSSTPTPVGDPVIFSLSLNQTGSVAVPAVFAQRFCADPNGSLFFSSANANDNVQIDSVTFTVTY